MRKRQWVGEIALLLIGLLALVVILRPRDYRALKAGVRQCRVLAEACREYSENPQAEGKYPEKLADLLAPRWGGPPLIDPVPALTDPWGDPYFFTVTVDERGRREPYVWMERTVDEKFTLVGAKWSADGKAVTFGIRP
jgi:hypothetical protein